MLFEISYIYCITTSPFHCYITVSGIQKNVNNKILMFNTLVPKFYNKILGSVTPLHWKKVID